MYFDFQQTLCDRMRVRMKGTLRLRVIVKTVLYTDRFVVGAQLFRATGTIHRIGVKEGKLFLDMMSPI